MPVIRPMLAAILKPEQYRLITYSKLGSYKLDGIRCVIGPNGPQTRSGEAIPNLHIRALLSDPRLSGFDGELMVPRIRQETHMQAAMRGVMTIQGKPDFTFNVFDDVTHPARPFAARYRQAYERILHPPTVGAGDGGHLKNRSYIPEWVNILNQVEIVSAEQLERYETEALKAGHEGIIIRSPTASYKQGRSTFREQGMMKVKRFVDAEAVVYGFEPLQHNANADVRSELDYAKRSTASEGMVELPMLGALLVRNGAGTEFKIGSGFTRDQRFTIWNNRDAYIGAIAKFKHQPYGMVEKPRTPIFLGWRDRRDM